MMQHTTSATPRRSALALAFAASLLAGAVHAAQGDIDVRFGNGGVRTIGGYLQGSDAVHALLPDAGGAAFAAGTLHLPVPPPSNASGHDMAIVRLRADGSLDPAFGDGGITTIHAGGDGDVAYDITRQTDGRLVVAGTLEPLSYRDFGVVRLLADGTIDPSFGAPTATPGVRTGSRLVNMSTSTAANDEAHAVVMQSSGKIVAGGYAYGEMPTGLYPRFGLMRLDQNGDLDTTFGTNGIRIEPPSPTVSSEYLVDIAVRADGSLPPDDSIVAVGYGSGGASIGIVRRYRANGTLDPNFGTNGLVTLSSVNQGGGVYSGMSSVAAAAIQEDGRIVLAGTAGDRGFAFIRLHANGTIDNSFGTNGRTLVKVSTISEYDEPASITLDAQGRILAGGYATVDADKNFMAVRLLPNGRPDPTFGTGGVTVYPVSLDGDEAFAVAALRNSTILFAGRADMIVGAGGNEDMAFMRLHGDPLIFRDSFQD